MQEPRNWTKFTNSSTDSDQSKQTASLWQHFIKMKHSIILKEFMLDFMLSENCTFSLAAPEQLLVVFISHSFIRLFVVSFSDPSDVWSNFHSTSAAMNFLLPPSLPPSLPLWLFFMGLYGFLHFICFIICFSFSQSLSVLYFSICSPSISIPPYQWPFGLILIFHLI